jgi:hypothetical protein
MLPSEAAEPFIADDTLLLVVVGCEKCLEFCYKFFAFRSVSI